MTLSLETAAVVAAVVYLILAIRQNIWCWAAALVSTALYLYIFYTAQLYMESALQVFYIGMAIFGWYQWRPGARRHSLGEARSDHINSSPAGLNQADVHKSAFSAEESVDGTTNDYAANINSSNSHGLQISSWSMAQHLRAIALVLVLTLASTWGLATFTDAALPLLDSLTTWGSVVATYMVARKILENWHYWFVIDSLSIYLYTSRGLDQTAMLFAVYLVLIVIGFRQWRKDMRGQTAGTQM